jgi:hypothetical protein
VDALCRNDTLTRKKNDNEEEEEEIEEKVSLKSSLSSYSSVTAIIKQCDCSSIQLLRQF